MPSLLPGLAAAEKIAPYPQQYYYYPQPPPAQIQPQPIFYSPMVPSYSPMPQQPQFVYAQQLPQMPQILMRAAPQSFVGMTPPTLIPDPDAESQRLLQSGEISENYYPSTTTTPFPAVQLPKNLLNLIGRSHHQPFNLASATAENPAPANRQPSAFEQSLQDAMNRAVSVLDTVPSFTSPRESLGTEALVEAPQVASATIPSWQELLGKEKKSGIFD